MVYVETAIVHPAVPSPAETTSVEFHDINEYSDLADIPPGLLLTYENYRAMRENIIEYRREIADLRATIEYYRSAYPESETQ